jgi:hypothetical protein
MIRVNKDWLLCAFEVMSPLLCREDHGVEFLFRSGVISFCRLQEAGYNAHRPLILEHNTAICDVLVYMWISFVGWNLWRRSVLIAACLVSANAIRATLSQFHSSLPVRAVQRCRRL